MTDFTVLVLPGTYATSVAATLDILGAARAIAPRMKLGRVPPGACSRPPAERCR